MLTVKLQQLPVMDAPGASSFDRGLEVAGVLVSGLVSASAFVAFGKGKPQLGYTLLTIGVIGGTITTAIRLLGENGDASR